MLADYVESLDRVLAGLKGREDLGSRRLAALVELKRRWAGPSQRVGIVNVRDLAEAGGEEAVRAFLELANATR